MIRSHRRDEPGRRLAFRLITAVILSGSGLSIALLTAGGGSDPQQVPIRTSDEVSRAMPREAIDTTPDDLVPNYPAPSLATPIAPTSTTSTPTAAQVRARGGSTPQGVGSVAGLTARPSEVPPPVTTARPHADAPRRAPSTARHRRPRAPRRPRPRPPQRRPRHPRRRRRTSPTPPPRRRRRAAPRPRPRQAQPVRRRRQAPRATGLSGAVRCG